MLTSEASQENFEKKVFYHKLWTNCEITSRTIILSKSVCVGGGGGNPMGDNKIMRALLLQEGRR